MTLLICPNCGHWYFEIFGDVLRAFSSQAPTVNICKECHAPLREVATDARLTILGKKKKTGKIAKLSRNWIMEELQLLYNYYRRQELVMRQQLEDKMRRLDSYHPAVTASFLERWLAKREAIEYVAALLGIDLKREEEQADGCQ